MKFRTGVVFTEVVDPKAVSPKQNRPNDSRFLRKGLPALSTFTVKKPYGCRFLGVSEFRENRRRKGRAFLMGLNESNFARVP